MATEIGERLTTACIDRLHRLPYAEPQIESDRDQHSDETVCLVFSEPRDRHLPRGRPCRPPIERRRTQSIAYLPPRDRKSTRLNSSHSQISYAVFCLKKKKKYVNGRLIYYVQCEVSVVNKVCILIWGVMILESID